MEWNGMKLGRWFFWSYAKNFSDLFVHTSRQYEINMWGREGGKMDNTQVKNTERDPFFCCCCCCCCCCWHSELIDCGQMSERVAKRREADNGAAKVLGRVGPRRRGGRRSDWRRRRSADQSAGWFRRWIQSGVPAAPLQLPIAVASYHSKKKIIIFDYHQQLSL